MPVVVICVIGIGIPNSEATITRIALVLEIVIPSNNERWVIFLPFVSIALPPNSKAPSPTKIPPKSIPCPTVITSAPMRGPKAFAALFIPAEKASRKPAPIIKITKYGCVFLFPIMGKERSSHSISFPKKYARINDASGMISHQITIKNKLVK